MPLWGKRDQKSDSPKFVTSAQNGQTGTQQFGNTVFGVDATETAVTRKGFHQGWVKVTTGTGGRNGRIQYETLVATRITGDATSFSNTSTSNVANSTGTADDVTFPDS